MFQLPKILSASLARLADEYTIKNEPIKSVDLMERASLAFVNEFVKHIKEEDVISIFCGTGNNGGDGFAIARILKQKDYQVEVYLVPVSEQLSKDCQINKERLKKVITLDNDASNVHLDNTTVIIDAIFGSGLTRPIEGVAKKAVELINNSSAKVISVDIPSGVFCDQINTDEVIIKSDLAITFQRPKLSFLFPETRLFLKAFKVVNIGLDETFIQQSNSNLFLLNKAIAKSVNKREKFSHKGTYGHSILYAGSEGKMGAATLAAKACLRSGVGLLTARIPACGYNIMQIALPEAMCSLDNCKTHLSEPFFESDKTIGIGPGLGLHEDTKNMVEQLLVKTKSPIVIDADGLNIIAQNQSLLAHVPTNSILTPHPKEFERLVGPFLNSSERLEKQLEFSKKHQLIMVVKDAHTFITDPLGNVFINTSGNPGMAKGGSGDALTGIILGLLAQHYPPILAALIGVYFHGLAGDKAKDTKGELAMLPSDLIEELNIAPIIV